MKHFLLARELPAIATIALCAALFGVMNNQPAFALWLLAAAAWCALLWLLLFRMRA